MSLKGTKINEEASRQQLWTFEKFEFGQHIGTSTQIISQTISNGWNSLYKTPEAEGMLPYGIVQLIVMRAYADVVQPRPPGNIHIAQYCHLTAVPSLAKELSAQVHCVGKYLKHERKMVDFGIKVADVQTGNLLCDAKLSVSWAQ